ncbi:MerR family transcriptional regulator [Lachnoclostridium sp. Marseille-P6806]|uniref:MerR family transcriptional regulator n=1 Tax=Lachnoclostridium sp. Marseille-P6806 TaxID=2364793 RepID=UPI001030C72B|nr:MerR family transcriptional regulator [Lachnoclostridium sp. Marseille-P6806]
MEKSDLIPIGKMAEINHITVAALRLYDEKGLLKPRYVDPDTGYRYYDWGQNARLDMIAYMKELGMTLQEIRDIFRQKKIALIEEILVRKNEQLYEQRRTLKERQESVQRAITSIERFRKSPVTGMISLEFIEQRYVWGIPCSNDFYSGGLECFEKDVARLRQELLKHSFGQIHSYNIGTSVKQELFSMGRFSADRVFVFVEHAQSAARSDVHIVESGMYGCIYADDFAREQEYAYQLYTWCQKNGYVIAGDYICEILTEFNVFDENQRGMFMRLQAPLRFEKS